jgi:hypothetical protein
MPSNQDYTEALEHEIEVVSAGSFEDETGRVRELERLLAIFRRGSATAADRRAVGKVLHGSAFNMLKLRRRKGTA